MIQGRTYSPRVASVFSAGAPLQDVLVAGPRHLRDGAAAAHDRPEVEHVVHDALAAVGAVQHVQRVDAARVVVVQPRGEDAVGPQLAAVFVRVNVVGVVGARAVVLEVAHRTPVGKATQRRAVLAVGQPRRSRQQPVDVFALHAAAAARHVHGGRACPR